MKSSLERERELSFELLSDARAKKARYNSQATRHTVLSDSVAPLCPAVKPYDWQTDVSEALALGLDVTESGKTLPWVMPLLLEENRDKIRPVISPLNELEADRVWQRLSLEMVDLTIVLLRVGSIFYREAQNTRRRCKP